MCLWTTSRLFVASRSLTNEFTRASPHGRESPTVQLLSVPCPFALSPLDAPAPPPLPLPLPRIRGGCIWLQCGIPYRDHKTEKRKEWDYEENKRKHWRVTEDTFRTAHPSNQQGKRGRASRNAARVDVFGARDCSSKALLTLNSRAI